MSLCGQIAKLNEDQTLALSVTVAKLLASDCETLELVALTSFLGAVSTNIGLIVQSRNRAEIRQEEAKFSAQEESVVEAAEMESPRLSPEM